MTIEQKEQQIISLLHELPMVQRIKVALAVLQGADLNLVQIHEAYDDPWMTPELEAEFDRRAAELRTGKVQGIPAQEVSDKLAALLS